MVNRAVTPGLAALAVLPALAAAGCGSFQDPNVVVDLRVLAIRSDPPDQVIDVDLSQPPDPAALLAELVPTQVCALVADPAQQRRLVWSMTICPLTSDDRCDDDRPQYQVGSGVIDDPDTTVPEPALCATVMPDLALLGVLIDVLNGDELRGLGGLDYAAQLRIGEESGDRDLDVYATKTLRVSPRIPMNRIANTNPSIAELDASFNTAGSSDVPLAPGRCVENPSPAVIAPGIKLRLIPIETPGAREAYVVPTLDGRSEMFTESLTYQWTAGDGGFSRGTTGGTHDLAGNAPALFSDFKSPAAGDITGPTDVAIWLVQRDERLGVQWYESCVRVMP
jgi:hypothetical protein